MFTKDVLIRNFDADAYRENFLLSAIVSIFSIRIFLRLTGYPQIGNGDFHIAHMLWGGFLMLAAIIILLSFLNKATANIAAILGGIGFGAFIDELGKFITRDHDYFFEPTVALMYICFVLLYLTSRFIPRYKQETEKEYLVNAIETIKESAVNDFDEEDERQAKEYLRHCDQRNPIVQSLSKLLVHIDALPTSRPGVLGRFKQLARRVYYRIAGYSVIPQLVIFFLVIQTVGTILQSLGVYWSQQALAFDEWGKLYASSLSGVFVVIGLFALRFSRMESYRFFRIALLITIFLTEFFAFMRSQWFELMGLSSNIFMLLMINYAMAMERQRSKRTAKR